MLAAFVVLTVLASGEPADEGPGALGEDRLESLLESPGLSAGAAGHRYTEEDFSHYFADGVLAEAKRAYDRRQWRTARRLFEGDALPVRYLRAMSAFQLRLPEAAAELETLAADYPALRDRCLLFAGRATERLGKPKAAAALYEAVTPTASLYAEARFALAQVLFRNRQFADAIASLEPLRALAPGKRNDAVRRVALLRTMQFSRARGDYRGEYRAMVELWATSPKSSDARRLWERIRTQPLPNHWRLRRAEAFLAFHEHDEALRLARQVRAQPPTDDGCRARFILGNVLRKERKHRAAIATLLPVVDACQQTELRPHALYVMGYSQSVVDKPAAVLTYETLAREFPDHPFADDALFFAAELHARLGAPDRALDRLAVLASRYPEGNFAAEGLFKSAWLQREAGQVARAIGTLQQLETLPVASGKDRSRARYWRARLLETHDAEAANRLFDGLVASQPFGWYGLLARARTPERAPVAETPVVPQGTGGSPASFDAGPLAGNAHFVAGVELLRMGLRDASKELLLVDPRGLREEPAELLAALLHRAHAPRGAALIVKHHATAASSRTWQSLYPLKFRPLVVRHARPAKVDPDLLQALMREESSFNCRARSSTGALGLAQLMPGTARDVARKLRLGPVSEEALMTPAINIRLGGAYLGKLIADLGSVPYAVAAYNAGPHRVRSWAEARGAKELDAWVEEIPFEETRNYVMRVLGSYGAYRFVYGNGAAVQLEEARQLAEGRADAGRPTVQ